MPNLIVKPDIRPYLHSDLKHILNIERESHNHPWDEIDFERFIKKLGSRFGHHLYVAEWREHIIGFACVVEYKWHFEVINIAVSKNFRGKGVGSKLMDYVKRKLEPYGKEDIYAHVRSQNFDGLQFFSKNHFKKLEVTNDFFVNGDNAVKLKYEIPELPLKEEHLSK